DFGGSGIGRCHSEQLVKIAGFEHLGDDVGSPDELSAYVELRDRGPGGKLLDALANLGVTQYVHRREDAGEAFEDLDSAGRKPAGGGFAGTLHEQKDF